MWLTDSLIENFKALKQLLGKFDDNELDFN